MVEPTQMANLNSMLNWQSHCLLDQQYALLLEFILLKLLWVKVSFPKGPCQKVNRILVMKIK